jgi:hypothetical protein
MIAHYHPTEESPPPATLRRARRLVAEALLSDAPTAGRPCGTIAPWKAWLFVAWLVAATGVWFACMLGWL